MSLRSLPPAAHPPARTASSARPPAGSAGKAGSAAAAFFRVRRVARHLGA